MKKLSKVLLLTLVLALLCGAVLSTVASAAANTSENEQALVGAVAGDSKITRFVEDFTDETIDVSANAETNSSLTPVNSNITKTTRYGSWRAVSSRGITYGELRLAEPYAFSANDNAININPAIKIGGTSATTGWTTVNGRGNNVNSYVVYEWDMATMTQYPAGFGIYIESGNTTAGSSFVKEIAVSSEDGKLTVGDTTIDLGAAKEWHHYAIVLKFNSTTDASVSKGALYQDGKLVAMLDAPVAASTTSTKATIVKSAMIGYYDQKGTFVADSTICVDNAVITQFKKDSASCTNLATIFGDAAVEDVTAFGPEFVYNADYAIPAEYSFAGVKADGKYEYYADFAAAYTAYKAGTITMIEIYKDAAATIDAPVVIKASAGVTFTDENADEATKVNAITAQDADGNTYYTFTNAGKKISYSFYKTTATEAPYTQEFGVGTLPSVPGGFVPVEFLDNPGDATTKLQFDGTWSVYKVVGEEKTLCGFVLATEADADAGVTYEVYPNYNVVKPFFEVAYKNADGADVSDFYFKSADYASVFATIADGATIKLYRDLGFAVTPVVAGTLYVDLNGFALYQNSTTKLNFFDVSEGAALYIYSSVAGAKVYTGVSQNQAGLLANYTGKADVHIGYRSVEEKDAYLNNVTAYVGAIVDNAAPESTLSVVGGTYYVANADYDALVGFGPGAKDIAVTMDQVTVYNNLTAAKALASFEGTLGGNSVTVSKTVIYNNAEKLVAVVGDAVANETVTLVATTVYGNVKGEQALKIHLANGCRFSTYDAETVAMAEDATLAFDNYGKIITGQYPGNGQYNNRNSMVNLEAPGAIIRYELGSATELAERFCEVEWFFDEKLPSIKEYWVRGIIPEFLVDMHPYPVSEERVTYTFMGVNLPVIGEEDASIKIDAREVVTYDLIGFAHNLSVYIGMDYYFYIPVASAVVSVNCNDAGDVDVTTLPKTADEQYYIFTIAKLGVRDFATSSFKLKFHVKTARGYEVDLGTSTSPVSYLESLFNSEETTQQTKDLVITFMDYLLKAAAYLSTEDAPIDVKSVQAILKGQAVPGTYIDYVSDEGGIRYGLSSAYLRLTGKPEYVFALRSGFVGTITINGDEYVIDTAGQCDGKNYITYALETMGDMADELMFTIKGTIGETQIDTTGKYCLANYYISQMDEKGNTPDYISSLYVYVKYAKAYEDAMN